MIEERVKEGLSRINVLLLEIMSRQNQQRIMLRKFNKEQTVIDNRIKCIHEVLDILDRS